ncbi:MAG: lipopolysaccharide biosynthesis protein [Candidatus Parvarchaeota archaeon]|nr:lipopolysaccharide biosynthesis protein [Candidatus Jingweiarchaeum tengchongense]
MSCDKERLDPSVTTKAVTSVKWSALMEMVSRIAQPIIFVILARLLTPEDFGVVATAMIAISFSQMFWDAGLSKALIQTEEAPETAANVVFWTNIGLAIVIYVLLFFSAPLIARFFKSPASCAVLRVLGIQIVIASLSSVQQSLFMREMDFKNLFWIRLLTAFFPGFFSIPLAFYGYGVWALVGGTLAGQLLNLFLLWRKSTWRPSFSYDVTLARKLTRFGFWVLLESFGAWLIIWGDNLIVGRYLGVHDLGVYRTGWMLVTLIFGLVLNPLLPVLYPMFSRLQNNNEELKNAFHKANRIVFSLALPMGLGLLVLGPDLANLFFGEKWQGLGFVLSVLGLMHGMAWLVGINAELYRGMGRPDLNTKLMWLAILYYLPSYYLAVQHGLKVFTLTRLAVAVVAIPMHIYLCVKVLKVNVNYLWDLGKPMILSSLLMTVVIYLIKNMVMHHSNSFYSVVSVVFLIFTGVTVYILSLLFLDREFIKMTRNIVRKAIA